MVKVTAVEAKTRFGELLNRVAQGEEVVITRHDKPVARLVPEGAQGLHEVRRVVAGLRELQEQIRKKVEGKALLERCPLCYRRRPVVTPNQFGKDRQ